MLGGIGRLLEAFGTSSIDVYEWAQADIRKVRLQNGPMWGNLTKPRPKLQFSGWQLAHAVTKADYLVERDLLLPGLGFLLQIDRIVDFSAGPNLRLVSGSAATLNDFTRSSLSGRVGQGLSLLFAQSKGYRFVCHLASDAGVASHMASLPRKSKAADFLFERAGGERMILESKASFSQAVNDPTPIKSTLKAALTGQIDYWMTRIVPPASKGFALYSCLRETGNAVPSALIFVDPPEQPTRQPVEIPESQVRRGNYAAWLKAMGLMETARALLQPRRGGLREIELPLIQIGEQQFAVSAQSYPHNRHRWLGTGLEVSALKAISAALNGEDGPLLAYDGSFPDGPDVATVTAASGSTFPDGSYFGAFDARADFFGYQSFLL
jgi:hypothetical protein